MKMIERVGKDWYLDPPLHPAPAWYACPWRSLSVAFRSAYSRIGSGDEFDVVEGSARVY